MATLRVIKDVNGRTFHVNPAQITAIETYEKQMPKEEGQKEPTTKTVSVVWLSGDDKPIETYKAPNELSGDLYSL